MKSFILLLLLLASLQAKEYIVDQKNKTFLPGTLHVKVGDTITFKNSDNVVHNAYTDDGANEFDIGMQKEGTLKSMKVKAATNFNVHCAIHPNMLIKVQVSK